MKINYFDFGLHKGDEIEMFLEAISPLKASVRVYGFEPHPELYERVSKRYSHNLDIKIFPYAVSDINGKTRLYIADGNQMEGNSIFKTKNNVDPNNFVEVKTIKFSDYLDTIDYKDYINVVRFNIEGAEIHLIEDIVANGLNNNIQLFLGAKGGVDILKCEEISHLHSDYKEKLKSNGIEVYQFCSVSQDNISDEKIRSIIKSVK